MKVIQKIFGTLIKMRDESCAIRKLYLNKIGIMTKNIIEEIREDISNDNLDNAQSKIDDLVNEMKDFKNDIYHQCHYLNGVINTKRFQQTGVNKFAFEAMTDFVSAQNVYRAIHDGDLDKYAHATKYIQNLYRNKNIRRTN